MPTPSLPSFTWRGGLFARTFLLIGTLLTLSLGTWLLMLQSFEREPRARQVSLQVAAIVNLTRAALVNSRPDKRVELLSSMAMQEGITVWPLEKDDQIEPLPEDRFSELLLEHVRDSLGPKTVVAGKVNGAAGLWISFLIEDDAYWVGVGRQRLEYQTAAEWFVWLAIAVLLSLTGAAWVSFRIDRPLRALADSARELARGGHPEPLPEVGASEIALVNHSFNWMTKAFRAQDEDRALILAGISHDLRTPITRLQLEIELAGLEPSTREAMLQDLDQMNRIVGKFLDYARAGTEPTASVVVDTVPMLEDLAQRLQQRGALVTMNLPPTARVVCDQNDLWRTLDNVAENAIRYGQSPSDGQVHVHLRCMDKQDHVVISVADRGLGVPPDALATIAQPFVRGDKSRRSDGGSGLGLAIVKRLIERHGGKLVLRAAQPVPPYGMDVQIRLPAPTRKTPRSDDAGHVPDTYVVTPRNI